jgi:hypothetical protein
MSKFLSAVAQTEFDSDVKQAFQSAGKLRDTVTVRNNVVGDIYKFRKMGKGMANQKASADLVTPMDVSHSLITCTLSNWNAPEYTDIFDQSEVNFDEKSELSKTIASALGRRFDQLIIDAMEASSPTLTAISHGTTGLTLAKLAQAATDLSRLGVPNDGNRFLAVSAAALADVLVDTTITSADYNTVRSMMAGEVDTFMGFKWKLIEARSEGGLKEAATIRNCWAWHRDAIGVAVGMDISTKVDWIADRTAWLCNGTMKAGACVRDVDGLIKIEVDE